ncbi:MAG TPA: hypothetical protein VE442_23615 [Jatrophihabitans sp.]|jgi:hypothetical protein|nr:hypothetical protein [Jatrophihabitans sp.]
MRLAFDSASPWDAQRLERIKTLAGDSVVTFYIRGTPGGFRHASADDVTLARNNGIGGVPNWESTADFFRTATIDDCKAAGKEALAAARACGFPDDGTIQLPFSFDYEIAGDRLAHAENQVAACQEGLTDAYRATVYGQSSLIRFLGNHGWGDRAHWLMASTFQASSSITQPSDIYDIGSPFVAMVQSHHADGNWFPSPVRAADVNTVTQPDKLGAWWPEGSEFAMPTLDEILDGVEKRIFGHVVIADGDDKVTFNELQRGLRTRSRTLTPNTIANAVIGDLPETLPTMSKTELGNLIETRVRSVFGNAATS